VPGLGIIGFERSGKTSLVRRLLHELVGRGLSVSTIKHAHAGFDIDTPGKDSHVHREAGASEVVVCDSHSNGRNVVLEELDPRARLAWGRQNRSLGQVHGIDNSYAALVMVGFHARAGTPGVLNHTINSGVVHQFRLNGEAYGEVDINAALAGVFGVPIAFVSGDDRVVAQSKSRFPAIETVTTMESIGTYSALLHAPKAARALVRDGVERALGRLADMTVPRA